MMKHKCEFCNNKIDTSRRRCESCDKAWQSGLEEGRKSEKERVTDFIRRYT